MWLFKCLPPSDGTTYDYCLMEKDTVIAQVSFYPNGNMAHWVRCTNSLPHGKMYLWNKDGTLKGVSNYVHGKRHDGVAESDAQERLTYMATVKSYVSVEYMLRDGVVDNGEALASASYEGHDTIVYLLLNHQTYSVKQIYDAWMRALSNGQRGVAGRLRPHLDVSVSPLDYALETRDLIEAEELLHAGFIPTESHVFDAIRHGHLETLRWCLLCSPDLRTHAAWNQALIAENYECARLLEPGYIRWLRALKDYFM